MVGWFPGPMGVLRVFGVDGESLLLACAGLKSIGSTHARATSRDTRRRAVSICKFGCTSLQKKKVGGNHHTDTTTGYGYGYGYILGPSPVPPIYLTGSFGLVRPAWI